MRRNLLLTATIDEVDEALAGLQTARRLLAEIKELDPILAASHGTRTRLLLGGEPVPSDDANFSLRHRGVTVAEASKMLHLSEEHIRRLLRRRELEGIAFGGKVGWRMDREYLERIVSAQTRAGKRHA